MLANLGNEEWLIVCNDIDEKNNALLKAFSNIQTTWDVFTSADIPSKVLKEQKIKSSYNELKKKGIKIRWITEVTKTNISSCKELLKIAELLHLEGINNSFAISESEYISTTIVPELNDNQQLFYSNSRGIVEHHHDLFGTLLNKAIPAIKKIKELEEGIRPEIIEIIANPVQILKKYQNLLRSSLKSLVIIIPSINTLFRLKKVGIISIILDISQSTNIKVRIILPFETSEIRKEIENIIDENQNLYIRYAEVGIPHTNFTIIVVDEEQSLVIELKDDTKKDFFNAIGFATFSNTKPTVKSYSSIFENLWILTDLYNHIKDSNKELEKANEEIKIKEDLISQVSHELRTPLVPIKGYIEMLLMPQFTGIPLSEKQKKAVLSIQRNVDREISLVEDILDVYTVDMGKLSLNKQYINIFNLIDQVIKDLDPLLMEKQIEIELLCELFLHEKSKKTSGVFVYCDINKIEQVLSNLIKNSIDFVPDKIGRIIIKIEKNDESNELFVMVEDNGIGIPEEKIEFIFKKFYQIHTHVKRRHGGTGLGLAICQGIIKEHGGRIWAEKDYKNGCKIIFSLPFLKDKIIH